MSAVSVKTVFVRATGAAANPTAEDIRRVTIPAAVAGGAGAFEFVCAHVRKTYALSAAQPLAFKYRDDEDEWITISSADELRDAIASATAARPLRLYISASADVNFAALAPVPATPTPAAAPALAAAAPPALSLPASTPNSTANIKAEPVAAAPAPAPAAAADVKADVKADAKSPAASVASVGSAKDGGADDDGFLHVSASDLAQSVAAVAAIAKPPSPAADKAAAPAPASAPAVEPVAPPKPAEAKATPAEAPAAAAPAPAPVTVTPIVAPAPAPAPIAADVKAAVTPVVAAAADEKKPVAAAAAPVPAKPTPAAAEEAIHDGVSCDGCGAKPIRGIRYNCVTCANYDLCAACERDPRKHPVTHAMLKIRRPIDYTAIAKQQQAQAQAQAKPSNGSGSGDVKKGGAEFKAEYEKDVTIDDCSKVVPGAAMHKVWRVRNTGASAWPAGTALAFVGGEVTPAAVQPADLVSVPAAKAGESVDVGAYLVMPSKAGRARGYYRLQLPQTHGGAHFGSRMWIDVLVVPRSEMPNAPAPDAAAHPTPSTVAAPAPAAAAAADVKVEAVAPKPAEPKAVPAPAVVAAAPKPDVKASEPAVKAPAPAPVKPAAPVAPAGPAYKYQKELDALVGMGFKDQELVMYLLSNNSGDVNRVVNWMLQNAH